MSDRLLYIYGVVGDLSTDLGLGLDGSPLRRVTVGRVAAVVSEHERAPEAGEERFWQHEAVVERLLEDGTVLPMRFGATVDGEGELETLLRSREEEFVALLAVVRGAVELSVRAELPRSDSTHEPGGDAATEKSGTEYMRDRGRALREIGQAKERLHEPLKDLSRRSLVLEARTAHGFEGAFRATYLVDVERVDTFSRCVDSLAEELGGEVSCTGPWPPYSFVAGAGR
ncbi:MAG: GvpL/GvpF family gas vesicle protein [Solirubrobacterales bacterium]